jgi:prepilin-type N-terminal cleavage/methylation domain-containing protein
MKLPSAKMKVKAFTLVELLVVIVIVAIFVALLLPAKTGGGPSKLSRCVNNLKQIDLATLMYSQDYNGQLPWQELRTNNSAVKTEFASSQFKILSGYYNRLPSLLVCPLDKAKTVNTNLEALTDQNISYFLNIDAPVYTTNHFIFSFGDRNLQMNGVAVKPGQFTLEKNFDMNWTREIHLRGGCLAFTDGHVEFNRTNSLNSFVQQLPLATNRLCIP